MYLTEAEALSRSPEYIRVGVEPVVPVKRKLTLTIEVDQAELDAWARDSELAGNVAELFKAAARLLTNVYEDLGYDKRR